MRSLHLRPGVGRAGPGDAALAFSRQGSSRTKATNGVHATNDIAAGIRGVGLSDVGKCFRIAEDVKGLLELSQIRRVLVVDHAGTCSGIVAQADIARHTTKRETGDLVREVSRPNAASLIG